MSEPRKTHGNSILTRELTKRFCAELEHVLIIRHAAALTSFSMDAFRDWRKRGLEDLDAGHFETDYAYFVTAYQSTIARAISGLVADIREKPNRWQASAWILERCFREDFGLDAGVIEKLSQDMAMMEQQIKTLVERHATGK